MPGDVLTALKTLSMESGHDIVLKSGNSSHRVAINAVGESMEKFVKDLLTGHIFGNREKERQRAYSKIFSKDVRKSDSIDAIVIDGDAFEIKKADLSSEKSKLNGDVQLNSSYPRAKLSLTDDKLSKKVKLAYRGKWEEKDLFYVIGGVNKDDNVVRAIYFIQGTCYAARKEIYESLLDRASSKIKEIGARRGPIFPAKDTKEIGRFNNVDPLGYASLRVRGMWILQGPSKVFEEVAPMMDGKKFTAYAIMERGKYEEMSQLKGLDNFPHHTVSTDDRFSFNENGKFLDVLLKKIKDPNNPSRDIDVAVIEVSW